MPKTITSELVNLIGKPDQMIDNLLDKQIGKLETRIGKQAKGIGNKILNLFEQQGFRVQKSQQDIYNRLTQDFDVDQADLGQILYDLQAAGILSQTHKGNFELSNNFIAQRARQKVEAERRVFSTMGNTIRDRMSRDELLDKKYLDYITPNLDQLGLSKEEIKFVRRSGQNIRIRRTIIYSLIGLLLALLAFMSWTAQKNYKQAQRNYELSEDNRKEIEAERDKTLAEKTRGDSLLIQVQIALDSAQASEQRALFAQAEAEALSRQAIADKDSIELLRQKTLNYAEKESKLRNDAIEQAEKYAELYAESKENEQKAKLAQKETEQLNKIINAQVAAGRALTIEDSHLRALVSLEAYKINAENPEFGNPAHPNIMKALYTSAEALNKELKLSIPAHKGSIRDILFSKSGKFFFTASGDGKIKKFEIKEWNEIGIPQFKKVTEFNTQGNTNINALAFGNEEQTLLSGGNYNFIQENNTANGKVLSTYSFAPYISEEIIHCGMDEEGNVFGLGRDNFWYQHNGKMTSLPHLKTTAITNFDNGSSIIPTLYKGQYEYFSYTLNVQSFNDVNNPKNEEYTLMWGSEKEVSYGEITSAYSKLLGNNSALTIFGFNNGRIIIIYTDEADFDILLGNKKIFKNHQARISDIKLSPNNKYLAVASFDGSVSVWDLEKYTEVSYQPMLFDIMDSWVYSIEFSPDSKHLLAGCKNGELYFWNLNPLDYARYLCNYIHQNESVYIEEQKEADRVQSKSPEIKSADELRISEYENYFGKGSQRVVRYRVCN